MGARSYKTKIMLANKIKKILINEINLISNGKSNYKKSRALCLAASRLIDSIKIEEQLIKTSGMFIPSTPTK